MRFIAIFVKLFSHPILLTEADECYPKRFIGDFHQKHVSEESTLWKNCILLLYNETIQTVRIRFTDNYVYIIVDKKTDDRGKYIANSQLMFGRLRGRKFASHFFYWISLKKNAATICLSTFLQRGSVFRQRRYLVTRFEQTRFRKNFILKWPT